MTSTDGPYGVPQIRVALGTVEVTDLERRAIAWSYRGEDVTSGALADRADARAFLQTAAETYARQTVERYLDAGGKTARMEAGHTEATDAANYAGREG